MFTFQERTCPSFPLGELENFALFELLAFLWGTFIKMNVIYLKCYKVLAELCLYMYLPVFSYLSSVILIFSLCQNIFQEFLYIKVCAKYMLK